jgi:hypothetical protein
MYDISGKETPIQANDLIDLRIRKDKHKGALPTLLISVVRDGEKLKIGRLKKDELFVMGVPNIFIGASIVKDLLSQSIVKETTSVNISRKHSLITINKVF